MFMHRLPKLESTTVKNGNYDILLVHSMLETVRLFVENRPGNVDWSYNVEAEKAVMAAYNYYVKNIYEKTINSDLLDGETLLPILEGVTKYIFYMWY